MGRCEPSPAGILGVLVAVAAFGCDSRPEVARSPRAPTAEEMPARVKVAGGRALVGFVQGVIRESQDLGRFQMSKHPTTLAEYRACRNAGACSEPPLNECVPSRPTPVHRSTLDAKLERLPATCVGAEAAAQHCAWLGGRLPTIGEWFLAARGPDPQRYPWGAEPPRCAQHPLGLGSAAEGEKPGGGDPTPEKEQGEGCAPFDRLPKLFRVGMHPKSASPSGLQDALLAPGELVASQRESPFAACQFPYVGCVVHGATPGSIDGVEPVLAESAEAPAEPKGGGRQGEGKRQGKGARSETKGRPQLGRVRHAYAYRCVWEEKP